MPAKTAGVNVLRVNKRFRISDVALPSCEPEGSGKQKKNVIMLRLRQNEHNRAFGVCRQNYCSSKEGVDMNFPLLNNLNRFFDERNFAYEC